MPDPITGSCEERPREMLVSLINRRRSFNSSPQPLRQISQRIFGDLVEGQIQAIDWTRFTDNAENQVGALLRAYDGNDVLLRALSAVSAADGERALREIAEVYVMSSFPSPGPEPRPASYPSTDRDRQALVDDVTEILQGQVQCAVGRRLADRTFDQVIERSQAYGQMLGSMTPAQARSAVDQMMSARVTQGLNSADRLTAQAPTSAERGYTEEHLTQSLIALGMTDDDAAAWAAQASHGLDSAQRDELAGDLVASAADFQRNIRSLTDQSLRGDDVVLTALTNFRPLFREQMREAGFRRQTDGGEATFANQAVQELIESEHSARNVSRNVQNCLQAATAAAFAPIVAFSAPVSAVVGAAAGFAQLSVDLQSSRTRQEFAAMFESIGVGTAGLARGEAAGRLVLVGGALLGVPCGLSPIAPTSIGTAIVEGTARAQESLVSASLHEELPQQRPYLDSDGNIRVLPERP